MLWELPYCHTVVDPDRLKCRVDIRGNSSYTDNNVTSLLIRSRTYPGRGRAWSRRLVGTRVACDLWCVVAVPFAVLPSPPRPGRRGTAASRSGSSLPSLSGLNRGSHSGFRGPGSVSQRSGGSSALSSSRYSESSAGGGTADGSNAGSGSDGSGSGDGGSDEGSNNGDESGSDASSGSRDGSVNAESLLNDDDDSDSGSEVPEALKPYEEEVEPAPAFERDVPDSPPEFPYLVVSDTTMTLWGKRIVSVSTPQQ